MSTQDNPNESREVSILKRNLRLAKRIVLGKQQPPKLLMILCLLFMGWDLLMILGFGFIGLGGSIMDVFDSSAGAKNDLTPRYFYTYAFLHLISLVGGVLMYRRRLTGFYIFAGVNIVMPFWAAIITKKWEFEIWWMIFSLLAIALFAINWNKFIANVRKKEKLANQSSSQQSV